MEKPTQSPCILDYVDYRAFLRDLYQYRKEKSPGFSWTIVSRTAGFSSRNFLRDVSLGAKNLSDESIRKLQNFLRLNPREFAFFQELVRFNQTTDPDQRSESLRILALKGRNKRVWKVRQEQYAFYAHWHHNSLRELLRFDSSPTEELHKRFRPALQPKQIQHSLELMSDLGLVQKDIQGRYSPTEDAITTGDEVTSLAIADFHRNALRLAERSIADIPAAERDLSCLVLSTSWDTFREIKTRLQAFRKEIASLADADPSPDRVIHLTMQLYPTTRPAETALFEPTALDSTEEGED
jgi:uncharacterized protein (TIGR02147 family)